MALLFMGGLPVQLALWISLWSVVAIVVSLKMIKRVVDRWNKPSIVVLILAFVLGLSAVFVPIYDVWNLIKAYRSGCNVWKFRSVC